MVESICSIHGCEKSEYRKTWCLMHYRRWSRNGHPLAVKKTPIGEPKRFIVEHSISYKSEKCLKWPYALDSYGYPSIRADKGRVKGHRLMCELAHGPQPSHEQREVAHGCGNKWCVNPAHLRWATPKENQSDRIKHGTSNRGERQWFSKLSCDDVETIRAMEGTESRAKIARRFDVNPGTIEKIHKRQRWSWL